MLTVVRALAPLFNDQKTIHEYRQVLTIMITVRVWYKRTIAAIRTPGQHKNASNPYNDVSFLGTLRQRGGGDGVPLIEVLEEQSIRGVVAGTLGAAVDLRLHVMVQQSVLLSTEQCQTCY